jgi:titin
MEEGEPPRFIIPLEDCTLFVGSTIELECKVTGVPMPTLKWSKDGRPLLEDGRFEWENKPEQGHYRLRIRDSNRNDEGTYRCVATNENGQASTKAFVKVDEGIEVKWHYFLFYNFCHKSIPLLFLDLNRF